jgi:hypothetical protein
MLDQPASGQAFWDIYDQTGIRPEWLIPVLAFESGLNPAIPNLTGHPYYGINQIGGTWIANHLGISPDEYLTWPASKQLSLAVLPYMRDIVQRYGPLKSGIRVYQANLGPATLATSPGLDDAIYVAPSPEYEANLGFDTGLKGKITPRDLGVAVAGQMKHAYVRQAIADAYALRPFEKQTDAVTGNEYGLNYGQAFLIAAGIVTFSGAAAWLLTRPAERTAVLHRVGLARLNPVSKSMQVQSLLFPREDFTTSQARAWARKHGYRAGKVDVTDQYVRLRQASPETFRLMRTVPFGESGIKAVVGRAA